MPVSVALALLAVAAPAAAQGTQAPAAELYADVEPTAAQDPDAPSTAAALGRARPGRLGGTASSCTSIDFEGLADGAPIGTVAGTPAVTFGPSWIAVVDSDDGGSGNFANEPSATTTALFLSPQPDPIDFDTGVQLVELFYSASAASVPITLTAWDGPGGTGNVVDMASGTTVGTSFDGAPCTGDPSGGFCLWDSVTLTAATNTIRSLTIAGAVSNLIGFDDMTFCLDDPCATDPSTTVTADAGGLNVPASIAPVPAGDVPFLGNGLFQVGLDDPGDACGLAPGIPTFLLVTPVPGSMLVPALGCGGGAGEVLIQLVPATITSGPVPWSGPGTPAAHALPIPFDTTLCGSTCFAQGFWIDPGATPRRVVLSNRLDMTLGI